MFHSGATGLSDIWGLSRSSPHGWQRHCIQSVLWRLRKSPRSWNSSQTLFTYSDCRNDQNLKISHNSPPHSWPARFTASESERHFGGLPS